MRFSTSSAATSASTRTRDSGSSVTLVETPLVAISEWTIASGRMRPHERFAAWLVTGPVGHLVAGVTDLAVSDRFLFVATGQQVVVVDRNSMQRAGAPIAVAADRIAVSPDGLRLYALHIASSAITVVSPTPLIP